MLIKGYDVGPLVPGESLLFHPGFWSNYLLAMCSDGGCTERPVPEWFGEDGADADALSEVLFDHECWPVFRVPAQDGPGAVVIYRNLEGDYGTDYLLTHPGRGSVEQIASWAPGLEKGTQQVPQAGPSPRRARLRPHAWRPPGIPDPHRRARPLPWPPTPRRLSPTPRRLTGAERRARWIPKTQGGPGRVDRVPRSVLSPLGG